MPASGRVVSLSKKRNEKERFDIAKHVSSPTERSAAETIQPIVASESATINRTARVPKLGIHGAAFHRIQLALPN